MTAPDGQATLSIANGQITILGPMRTEHTIHGGPEIAQLVLGCEDPRETVEEAELELSGDADTLVEVLFPWQHPMIGDEAL